MKRIVLAVFVIVCLVGVANVSAQGVRFGIGGGVLMPLGDYNTGDKPGWVAGADVTYWLSSTPVGIRFEGSYSQTSHDGIDGNTKLIGGMAELVYAVGTQADQIRPYVQGGVGFYNAKVTVPSLNADTSASKVGFGFGAGVAFKVGSGSTRVFIDGNWRSIKAFGSTFSMLPIRAGVRFGGGN